MTNEKRAALRKRPKIETEHSKYSSSARKTPALGTEAVSPLEMILSRLEEVTGLPPTIQRSQWQARCPAHDDDIPSLSVTEGDDGRVLLHCFAGCKVEAIASALGIKVSDLFKHTRRIP